MILRNKIAFITGASSGIGRSTALLFARNGAKIVLAGRNEKALQEIGNEIKTETLVVQTDVTDFDGAKEAIEKTASTFGQIDILVNAAGIIANGSIETTTREGWREMMAVNVDALFEMMQLVTPHLKLTKGSIVNISSIAGLRAFPNVLAYCVSKAAVDQLTRCTALDLAPFGVRVNAVNPGVVVTNLHRRGGFDEKQYSDFLEHSMSTHPLGRVGQPEEIAETILFLASEKSGWITGETFSVDGGRHLTCAR